MTFEAVISPGSLGGTRGSLGIRLPLGRAGTGLSVSLHVPRHVLKAVPPPLLPEPDSPVPTLRRAGMVCQAPVKAVVRAALLRRPKLATVPPPGKRVTYGAEDCGLRGKGRRCRAAQDREAGIRNALGPRLRGNDARRVTR